MALLAGASVRDRSAAVSPVITAQAMSQMTALAGEVHVDEAVLSYVVRLADFSRRAFRSLSQPI